MKIFLFLLFSNLCLPATAQADSTITKLPEVAAEFPGGNQALLRWIRENIHEIDQAPDIDFPGKVYIRFLVEADGKVSEALMVSASVHERPEQNILLYRFSSVPQWIPGRSGGKPVRSWVYIPINF